MDKAIENRKWMEEGLYGKMGGLRAGRMNGWMVIFL